MNLIEIKQLEDDLQVATYAKMDLAVERGQGVHVWTSDGTRFLDLYGGHAVCATGHSHPHVVEAIRRQAGEILFYSNLVYSSVRARAAEKLLAVAPEQLSKVFFCNSGTEANENAMRMARMATGRKKIISFSGSFHGRTADAISASFLGKYRSLGEPNVPGHIEAEFGDIASVEALAGTDTAAIILEPIQSMAGVREASPQYFIDLRNLCDRLGIVLIFDEVQTGVGRCGNWFFSGSEHAGGVIPDVVTLAKSLGSGIPVGACLVNDQISSGIKINDLGTTFGGGMVAMAAVLATLEAIEKDGMLLSAVRAEAFLRESFATGRNVRAVRGKGCLIGLDLGQPCSPIHSLLLDNHIITGTSSSPNVLRLLPPLCVTPEDLAQLVEALDE